MKYISTIFLFGLLLSISTNVCAQGAGNSVAVGGEAEASGTTATQAVPATGTTAQNPAGTQQTDAGKKEKKLPKSGMLASSGMSGPGSKSVDMPWGGVDQQGEEQAPIGGSVYKVNSEEWAAKVSNNSKTDRYSANVTVKLLNETGGVVKSQSFSMSLAPGESTERTIKGASGARSGNLILRSWRKQGS